MRFPFSSIINVSTLIFTINIVFLVIGALYYWSVKFSIGGETVYIILFVLLTAFMLMKIQRYDRSTNVVINTQFRWLSSVITLILGGLAAIAVPLLYHSRKFDEYVL
jgi:positive regulator of sigma E activity